MHIDEATLGPSLQMDTLRPSDPALGGQRTDPWAASSAPGRTLPVPEHMGLGMEQHMGFELPAPEQLMMNTGRSIGKRPASELETESSETEGGAASKQPRLTGHAPHDP